MIPLENTENALRAGIKKIDELQQATKELKEALQLVVDGVVFSDDGRIWTHWLETFQELLTKYKNL